MSEPSSCKSCNMPILWAKRDNGKYNRPLNAESAQAGFCIVDDVVRYTLMYTAHVCSAEDIQAYDQRRNVGFSVKREQEQEAQNVSTVTNLDMQSVNKPARRVVIEQTFDNSNLPWSRIDHLTARFHGEVEEKYYGGVYKVGCRKCGSPEGQPCLNLHSFRNYTNPKYDNPSIRLCVNPHAARVEDAGRLGFFSYQNGTL